MSDSRREMKVLIMGESVMKSCTFLGCSFEERAGFQKINVQVTPDFENATHEQITAWLEETERRFPVTDNIKADTTVDVQLA
mgnify:CR=1 FL=1